MGKDNKNNTKEDIRNKQAGAESADRRTYSGRNTLSGRGPDTGRNTLSGRGTDTGRYTLSGRGTGQIDFNWNEPDTVRDAESGNATRSSRYDYDDWKTRVYKNDDLRAARKHTWIGTEEEAAEIEARKTRIMQGLDPWDGSRTGSYPDMMGSRTGRFTMTEIDPPLREQKKAQEQAAEEPVKDRVSMSERLSGAWRSIRNIRVADSRRFKRFLVICAVFAVILALEISYFYVKPYVDRMPDEISGVNKQVKELRAENKELKAETDKAGDFESKKELKESWERLRDKLKEQMEVTSSL